MIEYIHLSEARRVLRLSSEEILSLLEKGEIEGRAPRLLSASNGYDYCTGWLLERRSVESYLAQHGRTRRKTKAQTTEVHAGVLAGGTSDTHTNTGF